MRRVGIWSVAFGVLSFALPGFGYDLTVFEALGDGREAVAIGLLVLGSALIVFHRKRKTAKGGSAR